MKDKKKDKIIFTERDALIYVTLTSAKCKMGQNNYFKKGHIPQHKAYELCHYDKNTYVQEKYPILQSKMKK
jgi:hypothetical protein